VGTFREKVIGSNVEIEIGSWSDVPPPAEAARLRASLCKLFPESKTPTIVVLLEWSGARGVWKIRAASQRIAEAAFVERSQDVAEALAAAGHDIEVRKNPMDSPPDGIRIPRKS
jgi:hypothetical protein